MRKVLVLFGVVLLASSCAEELSSPQELTAAQSELVQIEGESCAVLMAGQTIPVGSVCASIEESDRVEGGVLRIQYDTVDWWELTETHLWVGRNLSDMPQTRSGNPRVGHFPYFSGDITGATSWYAEIPLKEFGLSSELVECEPLKLHVVAHAAVQQMLDNGRYRKETAYGEGREIAAGGNWATWFDLLLTCTDDVLPVGCEHAYAVFDQPEACFYRLPEYPWPGDREYAQWGWVLQPRRDGQPDSYKFYAAVDERSCDQYTGVPIGEVVITNNGKILTVDYRLTEPGFTIEETNLYYGQEVLPKTPEGFSVAPADYGNTHDLTDATEDRYRIDLGGELAKYVIVHAVVCSEHWPE